MNKKFDFRTALQHRLVFGCKCRTDEARLKRRLKERIRTALIDAVQRRKEAEHYAA
jgi:hypothetical protein